VQFESFVRSREGGVPATVSNREGKQKQGVEVERKEKREAVLLLLVFFPFFLNGDDVSMSDRGNQIE